MDMTTTTTAADHNDRLSPAQAKQRASILWLLSKAFDSVIPPDLREPYYKDHGGEDRLKPYIVQALASGELYCLALSSIYQDPNYNNLSHAGVIAVLMRKGIYVQEPQDTQLTESILIRTNPIKMVSARSTRRWQSCCCCCLSGCACRTRRQDAVRNGAGGRGSATNGRLLLAYLHDFSCSLLLSFLSFLSLPLFSCLFLSLARLPPHLPSIAAA